jgi:hypothetical protein
VNASVPNGWCLAEHVPGSTLVVRPQSAHLATVLGHWDEILTTLRDPSGLKLSGPLTMA